MLFMDFLDFTFTNFWYFIGVLLLLSTALNGMASIVRAFFKRTEVNINTKEEEGEDDE